MTSRLFEANLWGPDDTASQQQLVELIDKGIFNEPGLPYVAHKYLDAFCERNNSNGRRRWSGIALAAMMRASTGVVQGLKKLTHGLSRVGPIILSPQESEERRIVAGLIIRQGLEAGIDFADFWKSDKVLHSAPNFPREPSELWMSQFQTYLDTLSNLALANLDDEPVVLFPIALSTRKGFQWTGKSAVALLEEDVLTVVTSDYLLTKFNFIDLPVNRVLHISLQQDFPHESQEGRSGHKMHNVVMTLRSDMRINSSDCAAAELKVSFLQHEDAHEFEIGLQDARKASTASAATTTGEATKTVSNIPPRCRKRASVQNNDPAYLSGHEQSSANDSETGSKNTLDEPISSKQMTEEPLPVLYAEQEKSIGKLPRVSHTTKQKAIRAGQLPSSLSKSTKTRASRKAAPIIDASEDEDENGASHDEYEVPSSMTARSTAGAATGKKSQGRRKTYADDDDFIPKPSTGKSTTKRKRALSDAEEGGQPTKRNKTQIKSTRYGPVNGMAKKARTKVQHDEHTTSAPTRVPMKQSSAQHNIQNRVTARPSLIGALKKSNSPSKAIAPTFKRPGQPASTPGRPRAQPDQTSPKAPTPAEAYRDLDGLPVPAHSSTPRGASMHEEDFGLGHTPANTELLSSNTKRVPDSPHAESTAISGHADRDEVQREKCIADLETAKSDPFKQRRQGVQKITSFTRKLTGESTVDDNSVPVDGESPSIPAEIANGDVEIDDFENMFKNKPLPKNSPSLIRHRTNSACQSVQGESAPDRTVNSLSANSSRIVSDATLQVEAGELRFGVLRSTHSSQAHSIRARKQLEGSTEHRTPPLPASEKNRRERQEAVSQRAQANDSVISAPQEAIDNTLPDAPALPANPPDCDPPDCDGETTLVDEEMDLPKQYGTKASELRFRSSPPIHDSSSVRGGFTDESEEEPEPSPPTSRADEVEWEAALQPHQRALHEQLLRTSKRVVRHIVDNETAVTDITDVFAADGERILDLLVERQSEESAEAFRELKSKRGDLLQELSSASKNLKEQRKRIRAIERDMGQ